MLLHETQFGDKVVRIGNTITVTFSGPRRTVSNSLINGGCRDGIKAVFNHCLTNENCIEEDFPDGSVEGFLNSLACDLGLTPDKSLGLLTAAKMENAVIKTLSYNELKVTAIVTAGVDVNGVRAGDPASYHETDGEIYFLPGTINIILVIDGNLPDHTLVKAIITATEAKTAALQELSAPSCYSEGLATGSGTDQIVVVSNPLAEHQYNDAGSHAKLGELIGQVVKQSVKDALFRETGLSPQRQRNFLARLKRFGITTEDLYKEAISMGIDIEKEEFFKIMETIALDERILLSSVILANILDELNWSLLKEEQLGALGAILGGLISSASEETDCPVNLLDLFKKMVINRMFNL